MVGATLQGKYKLRRQIGDGGMGSVFEAEHLLLGTPVAIKILHSELSRKPGIAERFLQEARISARIKSPHVVQIHDVEQAADGGVFIVMELLVGEPLGELLHRTPKLSVPTTLAFADQILEALEAAHALGVVHRDLKPDNVLVTQTAAGAPLLKLIDFGIAKARRDPQADKLTIAGMVMGTAEYMAPEQAFSADTVDGRADIYSLGVMLYEMLAGKRPLAGEDPRVIAMRIERGDIPPLATVAPEVRPELAALVHRALSARREQRFASASEMRAALRALGGSIPAPAPAAVQSAISNTSGTVLGAPVPAAVMQSMAVSAQVAPPQASQAVHAPAHAAYQGYTPAPAMRAAPPRKTKTTWWPFALLALALGGAVVFAIIYLNSEEAVPVAQPVVANVPTVKPTTAPTVREEPAAPLAPLITTGSPPQAPTTKPPVTTSTTAPKPPPTPDAGQTQPPVFPLPSGFPTVLPTAFPTQWQIPTGFPPFPAPPR